nr:reverse transcriptase domain-containing protein [Tanacetum cinerariifolium]
MYYLRHPDLVKKLNDKIPKMVDEVFKRVRAFIEGEVATGLAKVVRAPRWDKGNAHSGWLCGQERIRGRSGPREFQRSMGTCAPQSRRDTFTPLTKTSKEILAIESVNFPPPSMLIEEAVASRKLAHLLKDIHQGNQTNRGEINDPLGLIDLRVTIGEPRRNKTILLEFAIVKCRSPYNIILGRTRMRSLRAVGSTIHLMIKFPMPNGVTTMKTGWEAEFMERNKVASAYGINVKDKRAGHTKKPKHPQSEAQKRAYGL